VFPKRFKFQHQCMAKNMGAWVESTEAYLDRKYEELKLLNSCLRRSLSLIRPRSIGEVIGSKFQLTASIRAEHELETWTATETAWSSLDRGRFGPFHFKYDYQRADLEVEGPSFYDFSGAFTWDTVYTGSGMAAISALLLASAHVLGRADVLVLPSTYGESLELVERYAGHLRKVVVQGGLDNKLAGAGIRRMLLLDFCAPDGALEATLRSTGRSLDLLVFDTTCFAGSSGRIRRVLRWACQWNIPTVMVRSHNKLDSLGAEYGRLGSASFVYPTSAVAAPYPKLNDLLSETRNAIRLFGGAALPAHFPPYIGADSYRSLTSRRVAAILRNSRRTNRYFRSALKAPVRELHFAHGLYVTLSSRQPLNEAAARSAAARMAEDLGRAGFPIRHAGSFGFDFAAVEWFRDVLTEEYSVRIAVPDLPTKPWDDLTMAIARWWLANLQ
jgi:hypothetical protein